MTWPDEQRYKDLVPAVTQLGNQILLFIYGLVPYFLRTQKETPAYHEFVGECYVDDLMN